MVLADPRYSVKTDVRFSDPRHSVVTNRSGHQFSGYQRADPFTVHVSSPSAADRQRSPTSATMKKQPSLEMMDELLRQHLADASVHQRLEKLGGGYYKVGTKKIYAQMHNGRVMVKTANGYMEADDYIETYLTSNTARSRLLDTDALNSHLENSMLGGSLGGQNSLNRSMGSVGGGKSMTMSMLKA